MGKKQEEGWDEGKIEWKLSKVNTRAVSRGQNELIGSSDYNKWCD